MKKTGKIETTEKLNEMIVDFLRMRSDSMCHYAAKRIEELEEKVKALTTNKEKP